MFLRTVDEHNSIRLQERKEREQAATRTGVKCPKCGFELRWKGGVYTMPLQYPPSTLREAYCCTCALTLELEAE